MRIAADVSSAETTSSVRAGGAPAVMAVRGGVAEPKKLQAAGAAAGAAELMQAAEAFVASKKASMETCRSLLRTPATMLLPLIVTKPPPNSDTRQLPPAPELTLCSSGVRYVYDGVALYVVRAGTGAPKGGIAAPMPATVTTTGHC